MRRHFHYDKNAVQKCARFAHVGVGGLTENRP